MPFSPHTLRLCEIVRQSVRVYGKNTNYACVIVKNCVIPDHLLILLNPDRAVAFLGQDGAAASPDFGFLLRILQAIIKFNSFISEYGIFEFHVKSPLEWGDAFLRTLNLRICHLRTSNLRTSKQRTL